jgi:LAO/AO transport system kinase
MEIPDVIVVNKADHPLTDVMVREIRGVLSLGPKTGWRVPIVRTQASTAEGIEELADRIADHREHIRAEGTLEERRKRNLMNEVMELATVRLRRRLDDSVRGDDSVRELLEQVVERKLDPASAAAKLLEREI